MAIYYIVTQNTLSTCEETQISRYATGVAYLERLVRIGLNPATENLVY